MTIKEYKLAELCDIVSSKRVFAASYQSEGVPFFRGKEVSQLARGENTTADLYISEEVYTDVISRTGPINSGDILLTAVGTLGNPYQVKVTDLPFYFKDGNIVWLRNFSKEINSTYLFYWLNSDYGRTKVLDTSIGSTQAALTITGLSAISISCPSLAQQTGIVRILSAIDQKIAINNAVSKTLEEIVQTLFKSWFIDFDPVKAKMAGENPKGMDAATAALFPDAMEESELGMIPKGWKIGGLNDIAKTRKELAKVASLDAQINYVGLEHLPRNSLFFRTWSTAERVQSGKTYFKRNDILFGKLRPYFHKVVVSPIDGVCSTDIVVIQSFDSELDPYTASLVNLNEFVAFVTNRSSGTRMPRTSWQEMCEFKILIPGFDLILKFNELMRPLFLQALSANLESNNLEDIRNALLPRLISGDLQIPEEMLAS